ncbi:hypothetical protein [Amycolatopsis sp. CA-128772]|nr:hypothetical protein [Amycolatopsis sp. CA-128772]
MGEDKSVMIASDSATEWICFRWTGFVATVLLCSTNREIPGPA